MMLHRKQCEAQYIVVIIVVYIEVSISHRRETNKKELLKRCKYNKRIEKYK